MSLNDHSALHRLLADFAAGHRGVRSGSLFGRPALFAGRRVFAFLGPDGLRCRLPASEARRMWARSGRPAVLAGRSDGRWTVFQPPPGTALRLLAAVLERAAAWTAGKK